MIELAQNIGLQAWIALKATCMILFMVMGPGMILALCMHVVSTRLKAGVWSLLGRRLYLLIFGWLGICMHELGHAIMCVVFGHKVKKLQLFAPDAAAGTLGYVQHSFNPHNPYQVIGNFFIALGPIILGTIAIWAAAVILLPQGVMLLDISWNWRDFQSLESFWRLSVNTWNTSADLFQNIFTTRIWTRWQTWLFAYIMASVGSGISLSWSDISGGLEGFGAFFALLYIVVLVAGFFKGIPPHWINAASRATGVAYPIMLFALFLNGLLAVTVTGLNMAVLTLKH